MKLAAFDIEISKVIPEGETDWKAHRPLGISCAAIARSDGPGQPITYRMEFGHSASHGGMEKHHCRSFVRYLQWLVWEGYTLVGWNSLGFDFDVLAEESGMYKKCAKLAMKHVDIMFLVVAIRGHFLGLNTAAIGMGIDGKLKQVELSTGEVLDGMSGIHAPELWARREYLAVMEYLKEDVRVTLELAQAIGERGQLAWVSRSGRENVIDEFKLLTVQEGRRLPYPDTTWMEDPPTREGMLAWIHKGGKSTTPR